MEAGVVVAPSTSSALSWVTSDELHARYAAYRRRQASRLVQLVPRDAVRPLYRRARAAAAGDVSPSDDPLGLLLGFCERILPLPTFDAWRQDLMAHPEAHLADLDDSVDGPTADAPTTLEVRILEHGGRSWLAQLRGFRDQGLWRGFIAFEDRETGRVHRTATVFCEGRVGELRERFLSFEPTALRAFLRSALP